MDRFKICTRKISVPTKDNEIRRNKFGTKVTLESRLTTRSTLFKHTEELKTPHITKIFISKKPYSFY